MIKNINTVFTPKGLEILTTPAIKCESVDSGLTGVVWYQAVHKLVKDLKDTAEANLPNCVGLASNQIWDELTPPLAVIVVKGFDEKDPESFSELINPVIKTSGNSVSFHESCLSVPKVEKKKKRKLNVTVSYSTLDSTEIKTRKVFGFKNLKVDYLPIILQHEYDHLLGKTI